MHGRLGHHCTLSNQCNGAFHACHSLSHGSSFIEGHTTYQLLACMSLVDAGLSGRLALASRPLLAARSTAKKVVPWILVRFWLPLVSEQEGINGGSVHDNLCMASANIYLYVFTELHSLVVLFHAVSIDSN